MPKIESSNIEIYIRQLISERLGNDVKSRKHILNDKVLKVEKNNLTNRELRMDRFRDRNEMQIFQGIPG